MIPFLESECTRQEYFCILGGEGLEFYRRRNMSNLCAVQVFFVVVFSSCRTVRKKCETAQVMAVWEFLILLLSTHQGNNNGVKWNWTWGSVAAALLSPGIVLSFWAGCSPSPMGGMQSVYPSAGLLPSKGSQGVLYSLNLTHLHYYKGILSTWYCVDKQFYFSQKWCDVFSEAQQRWQQTKFPEAPLCLCHSVTFRGHLPMWSLLGAFWWF